MNLLVLLFALFSQYWTVPGTVKYDYIGNSFNSKDVFQGKSPTSTTKADHKWVQNFIQAMCVSSNGTVYAYSNWDEGGHLIGMYKNGDMIGEVDPNESWLGEEGDIVTDDNLVFSTSSVLDGFGLYVANSNGTYHYDPVNLVGHSNTYIKIVSNTSTPNGLKLALDKTAKEVYFSVPGNKVYVYATDNLTQTKKTEFVIPGVIKGMTSDNNGNLWILRNDSIAKYTNRGVFVKYLFGAKKPTLIRYNKQNELMVWDNSSYQVLVYRNFNTSTPSFRYYGVTNGTNVSNGVLKETNFMPNAMGIDTDNSGNLYITWGYHAFGPTNSQIMSYNKTMKRLWYLYSNTFVHNVGFDKNSNLSYAYTSQFKLSCDWSKPTGQKFTPIAFTWDNVSESEGSLFAGNTYNRFVKGKNIIVKSASEMTSNGLVLYVEVGGKFVKSFSIIKTGTFAWYVDYNGDIWWGDNYYGIIKYKFSGYSSSGLPKWDTINKIVYTLPDSGKVTRIWYDESKDDLVLTMYNKDHTNMGDVTDGSLGNYMIKYSNYTKQTRKVDWADTLKIDTVFNIFDSQYYKYYKRCMWAEKDYIFIVSTNSNPQVVDVYRIDDGSYVGKIIPGVEIGGDINFGNSSYGAFGYIDMTYGMNVTYRSNGMYVISIENDATARNFLYLWCPSNNCQGF